MKKFLLLAAMLTSSAMASEFSYTNLDLGYSWGKAELLGENDLDLDLEGFFVGGRYEITNNFFVYGNYEDASVENDFDSILGDFDVDTWRAEIGVGGYAGLGGCVDVYYSVGYKYTELELGDLGGDDQNVGNIDLNVGLRWAPATWVEINPYLEYSIGVDDDDDIEAVDTFTAGLNVYVTAFQYVQPFVGVAVDLDNDNDSLVQDSVLYSAGVRFSF